jgi:hypothetical protein
MGRGKLVAQHAWGRLGTHASAVNSAIDLRSAHCCGALKQVPLCDLHSLCN